MEDKDRELEELEKVVLANRGMILFLLNELGWSEEKIDNLEEKCTRMAEDGFKEFYEKK